jgi:hypothetical protein
MTRKLNVVTDTSLDAFIERIWSAQLENQWRLTAAQKEQNTKVCERISRIEDPQRRNANHHVRC